MKNFAHLRAFAVHHLPSMRADMLLTAPGQHTSGVLAGLGYDTSRISAPQEPGSVG